MKKLSELVTKNKMKIGVLLLCFMVLIVACIHYANNNKQIATITTPEEQEPKAQQETVPEGYIGIISKEELAAVKDNLSGNYILMADIDMTDIAFEPIGTNNNTPFKGIFDGNYHKISNLKIESANQYVGMFGYITGGTVENLLLENVNVKGTSTYAYAHTGGLTGDSKNGTINNICITGEIAGCNYTGGLVGANDGTITNSYSTARVTGTGNYVGGLVSYNSGTITNLYVTGEVIGVQKVGGLLGYNDGTVTNAYSTATVTGLSNVGGLVGESYSGSITNTYTVGEVNSTQTSWTGGLVGYNRSGRITDSYYAMDTTKQTTSSGGEGKFFSTMLKQDTFANWDFDTTWQIEEGATLPYIKGIKKPEAVKEENYEYVVWEGAGTEESPYLVKTAKHLQEISDIVLNAHYKLANDIDMTDEVYEPIGTNTKPFSGTFDGAGHKISNLKIESENQYVGMFGYINGGTVKNLLLENVNIKGTNTYVGGLAGYNKGTITNVGVTGEVTSTNNNVGGLLGYNDGTVTNAYSTVAVAGTSYVGGLIGDARGTITNTYAVGKVTATGTSNIGGLTGYKSGTVTDSYWAVDTTTQVISSSGEVKFFSSMLKQATFKNWDFDTVWQIEEGATLPYLKGMAKPEAVKAENYTYTDWEGEGTEENPYLVKGPRDLRVINYTALNAYYKLVNDIDMADEEFEVIGPTQARAFTGTVDGNNHKISNLKIESANQYVGMFGYISGGKIKNLLLENVHVKGTSTHIGGLAGSNYNGTITNVGVTGEVTSTNNYVGGLLGYNGGTVTNAYSTVVVSGNNNVGGLIGDARGTVTNTYAVGKVTATGTQYVGGLTGYKSGTVNNSYWAADTTGQSTSPAGEARFFSSMLKQATFKNWDFETTWQIEAGATLPYLKGMTKPEVVKKENYTYTEWEGEGTAENPYLVKTANHLKGINNIVNAHYKLANDIDMKGVTFEPIGTNTKQFTGTFDGNNHKIINLTIESENQCIGMFGYINGGTVKNLLLENVNITGTNNYVGGVVGQLNSGTITNVGVTGEVRGTSQVGGLVGYSSSATITKAYSTANVTGTQYIGGLIGNQYYGTTTNAYSTANVTGTQYIGGLIGNQYYGTTTNTYAVGKVTATGTSYVGGLVGNKSGTINNSYWAVDTTGQSTSPAGERKFFNAMLKQNAFTNWDFDATWQIEEGATLPYLVGMAKPEGVKTENYTYTEWEGEGTAENPYLVRTANHLKEINNILNANYILANDIDMQDEEFEVIGQTTAKPFTGTFDGNNHKISNLKIESESQYVGMFGYISGGTIKNLLLENVNVKGTNAYVGGLAGSNYNGTIINVGVTGEITSTGNLVGGLLGYNRGTVTNSYSIVTVTGEAYVGGLVGQSYSGSITNTYAAGEVTGTEDVGGLTGYNSGTITNAYSTAKVTGTSRFIGGLVGESYSGSIANTYAVGEVTGNSSVGGLIGYNRSGKITYSYYAFDTTKQSASAGGEGKFFNTILKKDTFKNWDFENVWQIEEGATLPYLIGMTKPEAVKKENNEYTEWEGEGTESNPYLIKTADQLNSVYYVLNAHYKLANDIDMEGITYNIIGQTDKIPFTGTFDGDSHTISNLKIESTNDYVGMFGYINGGTVKNVVLENANIKADNDYRDGKTGGLVGYNNNGTITNAHITGTVSEVNGVGGLVGYNVGGSITNSYAEVTVTGNHTVGGLVGSNYTGTITNSYSKGEVTGTSYVGGLVGSNGGEITNSYSTAKVTATVTYASTGAPIGGLTGYNGGTITNAYTTGEVTATLIGDTRAYVGGLVGQNNKTITNAYAVGKVTGGGLVGYNYNGTATSSYWAKDTTKAITSGVGEGKLFVEMLKQDTFIDWDFENIWQIEEGSLPYLKEIAKPEEVKAGDYEYAVWEGEGTEENPYLIKTPNDLRAVNYTSLSAHYKLANDIDMTDEVYEIIGQTTAVPFTGTFDGVGHKISNITIEANGIISHNWSSDEYVGFFGYTEGATIKNLTIENEKVDSTSIVNNNLSSTGRISGAVYIGGLIAYAKEGSVENNYIKGTIASTETILDRYGDPTDIGKSVGGLIGYADSATINKCYVDTDINAVIKNGTSVIRIGGLIGNSNSNIEKSCAVGNINVDTEDVVTDYVELPGVITDIGGISGNGGNISNVYSIVNITANVKNLRANIGGLAGQNGGTITNAYVMGKVNVDTTNYETRYDGTIGNGSGERSNIYWSPKATGVREKVKPKTGTNAKTIQEMLTKETYEGFDFEEVWEIKENGGSLPYLKGLPIPEKVLEESFAKLNEEEKLEEENRKKATTTKELKEGDYIKYNTGVSTIGDNGVITCAVLYDANSPYGLEIVSMDWLEAFSIGNDDNANTTRNAISNCVNLLNQGSQKYLNRTYATYARSIGTYPNDPDKHNTTPYVPYYSWANSLLKGIYVGNENIKTDVFQLLKLGIEEIKGFSDNRGLHDDYYLAGSKGSRRHRGDDANEYVGVMKFDGDFDTYGSCYLQKINPDYGSSVIAGKEYVYGGQDTIRPCFKIRTDLVIFDGDGKTRETAYNMDLGANYKVEHYKQNRETGSYDLAETETKIGVKNRVATAVAKTYEGYKENTEHPDRVNSGTVLEDGSLVLKLYYDRDGYDVTIGNREEETKAPVQNAVVGLFDQDENAITDSEGEQITTIAGKNGQVIFANLKSGTYKYKQLSVPAGYILNDTMYTFTIAENGTVTFEEENGIIYNKKITMQEKDNFAVTKYRTGTEIALSGAVIGIFDTEGNELSRQTTGESGTIIISGLEVGSYYYKEISAPAGYVLNNTEYHFTVTDDGSVTFAEGTNKVIYNSRVRMGDKDTFTVTKYRTNTEIALSGAVIGIFDVEGNELSRQTTGENGAITISRLEVGSYYYKEISAPAGYVLNNTEYHFIVENDGSVTLAEGTTKVIYNNRVTMSDKDNFTVTKYRTGTDIALSGAVIGIFDAEGNKVSEQTTGESGTITISGLEVGSYYYKEIQAPAGYVANSTEYHFTVNNEGRVVLAEGVDGIIYNDRVRMGEKDNFTVTKYRTGTEIALSGATIGIFDTEGNEVSRQTTGENGTITISGLEVGNYYYKEISAPAGYVLNNTEYHFIVENDGTVTLSENTNKVIYNDRVRMGDKDTFTVTKYRTGTDIALSGAVIGIFDKEGNEISRATTGESGTITISGLEVGNYYYKEISAPAGYMLNNTEYHFTVTDNGSVTFAENTNKVIYNDRVTMGEGLTITKYRTNTAIGLPGAVIGVFDVENEEVTRGTTNEAGQVTFTGLEVGEYYYKEISAPAGYVLNDAEYHFTVENDGTVTLADGVNKIIYNDRVTMGEGLTITKYRTNTIIGLPGATIAVFDNEGNKVTEQTTDESGTITISGLEVGSYYYKEISAPAGYILNNTEYHFTVENDGSVTLAEGTTKVIYNNRVTMLDKDTFTVTKYRTGTDIALSGAVIGIFDVDGNKLSEQTTGENGTITISGLEVGEYYYKEVSAPAGYVLNSAEYHFTVENDGTVTFAEGVNRIIYNDRVTMGEGLTITKYRTNTTIGLPGATIAVFDEEGNKVAEKITGENGTVTFTGLEVGEYYYKEISAPAGYVLNDTEYHFTVNNDGTVSHGEETTFIIYDSRVIMSDKDTFTVTKYRTGTEIALSGAVIGIFDVDGNKISEQTTGESGIITISGLEVGEYYYKEITAPAGYVLNNTEYHFAVENDGTVTAGENTTFVIYNDREIVYGDVTIRKYITDTQTPLAGAVIGIFRQDGTPMTDKEGNPVQITTSAEGTIKFKITPGIYIYKEIQAPTGYVLDNTDHTFTVSEEGVVTFDSTNGIIYNTRVTMTEGLTITKYKTGTNIPVAGAIIGLFDVNGKEVTRGTTNGAGQVTFTGLEIGSYYYKEISAPTGYVLNNTEYHFTVENDGTIKSIGETNFVIYNDRVKAEHTIITKYITDTEIPVAGAIIGLFDVDGNEIVRQTTDEKGQVDFTMLEPGTYKYKELIAPEGYVLNDTMYTFTIAEDGTVTFDNANGIIYNTKVIMREELVITKYKTESEIPVAGAIIGLFDEKGNEITRGATNEAGQVTFTGLEIGSYYYKEISAPTGYILNNTEYHFTVNNDGTVTLAEGTTKVIYNDRVSKDHIIITKYVTDTTSPVPGAVIGLFDVNGNKLTEQTTDGKGQVDFAGLEAGTYKYKELTAPEGYVLNDTMYTFTIAEDGTVTFDSSNGIIYNSKVTMKDSLIIVKYRTNTKTPVPGAVIGVFDEKGKEIARGATDENGTVTFTEIQVGNYYYKEISAPKGYALNSTEYHFTVNNNGSVTLAEGTTKVIYNDRLTVDHVIITKYEEGIKVAVTGAVIGLFDVDGNEITRQTTNEKGQVDFTALEPGTYKYKELTAPDGYVLNDTMYTFTIAEDGTITFDTANGIIYNKKEEEKPDVPKIYGDVTLVKYEEGTTLRVEGAIIGIYDKDGNPIKNEKGNVIQFITNEYGEAKFKIRPGTYQYKELKAPDGYILNETTYTFSVAEDGTVTFKENTNGIIYNKKKQEKPDVPEVYGNITIVKYEEGTKTGLKGAIIGIYDINKKEVKITTGENGTVSFKAKPGVYQYQELVAPDGYELNNTIYTFTVTKTGEVIFDNNTNGIIYDKKKEEKPVEPDTPDIPDIPDKPDVPNKPVTPDTPKGNTIIPGQNTIIKEQPENMVNGRLPQTGETEGTIIVTLILAVFGIYFGIKIRNKQ